MELKEFQNECLKLIPKYLTRGDEALIGLMGLNSGSGAVLKRYKKTLYDNHELDTNGFTDELAYILCYLAITAHAIDCDLETVMERCVEKIRDAGDQKN